MNVRLRNRRPGAGWKLSACGGSRYYYKVYVVKFMIRIACLLYSSIGVGCIGVGLLEPGTTTLVESILERFAFVGVTFINLETFHEGVKFGRALFLDNLHSGRIGILARESTYQISAYSIPLFSISVLRFLAVPNMQDLLSIFPVDYYVYKY